MLVLTRHCGEQIVIAGEIVVTVLSVDGGKIRLGIDAPRSVRVDRREVHNRRISEDGEVSFDGKEPATEFAYIGRDTDQ